MFDTEQFMPGLTETCGFTGYLAKTLRMIHTAATVNPFPVGEFVPLVLEPPRNGLKGSYSKPEMLRHLLHVGMHNRLELKQDGIHASTLGMFCR